MKNHTVGNKPDLVVIRTVHGELSAHLVKSQLESAGIPVILRAETYFNLILASHAPFSILVPKEYSHEAEKIVSGKESDLVTTIPKKRLWLFAVLRLLTRWFAGY